MHNHGSREGCELWLVWHARHDPEVKLVSDSSNAVSCPLRRSLTQQRQGMSVTQWVRKQLGKHEGLSSNPRTHMKSGDGHDYNPSTESSGACWQQDKG